MLIKVIDWGTILKKSKSHNIDAVTRLFRNKLIYKKRRLHFDSKVSKEWVDHSVKYLLEDLSPGERITLYAYSSNAYREILDFVKGGSMYKEFVPFKATFTNFEKWKGMVKYHLLDTLPELERLNQELDDAMNDHQIKLVEKDIDSWLKEQPNSWVEKVVQPLVDNSLFETACVFMHQVRIFDIKTITEFRKQYLHFTAAKWSQILKQYIEDMKNIFENAPKNDDDFTVFRGVKKKRIVARPGYMSTTLSKSTAKEFTNHKTKCCLLHIVVPKADNAIIMLVLSQFPHENEVLVGHYIAANKTRKRTSSYSLFPSFW